MRRPVPPRGFSLRSPVDVIARLADHIGIATLPAQQRMRLLQKANLFNRTIREPNGTGLKSGLAQLLCLPHGQAREVAYSYIDCPYDLRLALGPRLVHLGRYAPASQIQSFLKLIPKLEQPLEAAVAPLLSRHPELRPWINAAKSRFKANPDEVLDHIIGELSSSNIHLAGGGHRLETFEELGDAQLSTWTEEDRRRFEQEIATMDPNEAREAVIAAYGDRGFDLSGTRWAKFFLKEQQQWFIAKRQNGVRCFRVPRHLFNNKAWKNTVMSAKGGTSPVGGKSLFPAGWGRDEIAAAIVAVLDHPEPVVLRRRFKNHVPHFYLRSKVGDVEVEVGFNGDKIGTAFPSWRQYHPSTIGQAYLEWHSKTFGLLETIESRTDNEPLFYKLDFPHGFADAYLGKIPDGVSEDEWNSLKRWLCPAFLSEAPILSYAAPLQLIIFEWLERSRVVQELEGVEGAVR